jgi:hypothetical protein
MKMLWKSWIVRVAALMLAASVAFAQDRVPFRQQELDQMLAPIALYPDSLLSQMLMASTYPLEVVQAARWSRANRSLKGEQAVKAVEGMDWDPSVKSLVAFPEVLAQMDEKLDWTERLGEAFLAQQKDVMDSIQHLRQRADAAGNLKSNERMRVVREPENIVIEPPAREVVYVPYYSPAVVYGPWWYPAYPPVFWAPPPAYYAYGPAFYWGPAIAFSTGFFFGAFDWGHRHTVVHHHHGHHHHHAHHRSGASQADAIAARRTQWRHDPAHRRGVPFRTAAARERFEEARNANREQRAERGDGSRVERGAEDTRTADLRQSRMDDRRNDTRDGRDGGRQSLRDEGNRPDRATGAQPDTRRPQAENRNAEPRRGQESRDAQDNRGDQAGTRQARPESRGAQPDRDGRSGSGRSERSSGGDRRGDRTEPGNNVTRFQARSSEVPVARAETGTEARPSARPETRAAVQAELQRRAQARPAPAATWPSHVERRAQAHSGGQMRSAPEPRRFSADSAPAPRASAGPSAPRASAGAPAPRMQGHASGNAGRGAQMSRGDGRRS